MTFAEAYSAADAADREWLLERAAIREHCGGQSRADAERGAVGDWERWRSVCAPAHGHGAAA
jgi:hypothetical protein